jgi:hypothetical protein
MPKPKTTITLHVNEQYTTGFVVRTAKHWHGRVDTHVLSRKTGEWIQISEQQIREHDIPSECIFAADEMPAADQP